MYICWYANHKYCVVQRLLLYNLFSDWRESFWRPSGEWYITFGSSLCVCMSSSLSVLLVPLQELQAEGHCTSTVAGGWDVCFKPLTVYIYILYQALLGVALPYTARVCFVTVQKMSKLTPEPFLNLFKPFLPNNYLQCQRATHNTCNAYSVHGESELMNCDPVMTIFDNVSLGWYNAACG